MQFFPKLKQHLPLILLILLSVIISVLNYKPGTWLIGWDNLMPEFDFGTNIQRSVTAVWQTYQGLGLVGGMGHAADLPRQILLFLASAILPTSFLRYFWTFLMLIIGPVGTYYLIRQIRGIRQIAFLGGLFYLLNLATVQIFYTPYETFTTHYGFLPWLLLVFDKFLKKPDRKNLLRLIIINIFALPQAYVPTVFMVYLIVLGIWGIKNIKNLAKALGVILIINAFWILPFAYFNLTNISITQNAHINFMATEDTYLKNKKFGTLENVTLLRGFWFDTVEFEKNNQNYFLDNWRDYLSVKPITVIGYGLFGVVLLGFLMSLKKPRENLPVILLFIFCFTILASDTPPFSYLDSLWVKIPLLSQVFRNTFTKFGNLAALIYSILFSLGAGYLISKKTKIIFFGLASGLIIFTWPVFTGNLIEKNLRLSIPGEYFQLFDYFKTQPSTERIANLPQNTFWGWSFYRWGYHGSGFLWYGIKQPILDRAFDVWSNYDENYYWEISQAIYSRNLKDLENALEKYQIQWMLVDENIVTPKPAKSLYTSEIEDMIEINPRIKLTKVFGNGPYKIKLYKYDLRVAEKNNRFITETTKVASKYLWTDKDTAFEQNSYYIYSPKGINYLFPSLFTKRTVTDREFEIQETQDYFLFKTDTKNVSGQARELYWDENLASFELKAQTSKEGVKINKIQTFDWSPEQISLFDLSAKSCDPFNDGQKSLVRINSKLQFNSVGSGNCFGIDVPYLSHKFGYLIKIQARNIQGKSLSFYIVDKTSQKAVVDTNLPKGNKLTDYYFVLPPLSDYGQGYSINFDNVSIGRVKTVNEIGQIEVYPIPYNFLADLKVGGVGSVEETLVLSQAYHPGWVAWQGIPLLTKPLEHVMVNNWENGWALRQGFAPQRESVYIFFLPQILEYLGFTAFFVFCVFLLLKKNS